MGGYLIIYSFSKYLMDCFYVADGIMIVVDRGKGKILVCKDTFLVVEDFIDHWGAQITRVGKILSLFQTVAQKPLKRGIV